MSAFKSVAILALAAFATAMPTSSGTGGATKETCSGTQAATTCGANQELSCCNGGLLGLDCLLIDLLDLSLADTCATGTVTCCDTTQTGLINVDVSCDTVDLGDLIPDLLDLLDVL